MRRRNWGIQQPPLGSQQNPSHPLSQRLIGHWLLNENSGLIAYDLSPSRKHGTLTNGPLWTEQRSGAVVSFDGTNNYISVSSPTSDIYSFSSSTSVFTLSAWVRFNAFASARAIITKWVAVGNLRAWHFNVLGGDLRLLFSSDGIAVGWTFTAANACVVDLWQHCVVTFDNGSDTARMYVNGQEVSVSSTGSPLVPLNSSANVNFGASKDGIDDQLNGYLSDVRIYNRVLSPYEVRLLYRSPYADILAPRILLLKKRSGGGSFFIAPSGSLSSTGALPRLIAKSTAGIQPSAGVVNRQSSKTITGNQSSIGGMQRQINKKPAGTLSSGGVVAKAVNRFISGASALTGIVPKQINKLMIGSVSSNGILATVKVVLRIFTGALLSTGITIKQTNKIASGAISAIGLVSKIATKPFAGAASSIGVVIKSANKAISGSLSTSGLLSLVKVILRIFTGVLSSSSLLIRQTQKKANGTVSNSGLLVKVLQKGMTGTLLSVGSIIKIAAKIIAGTLTLSGTVANLRVLLRTITGTLTNSGLLIKQSQKSINGSLLSSSVVTRVAKKTLTGALLPSGLALKLIGRTFTSALAFVGSFSATLSGFTVLFPTIVSIGWWYTTRTSTGLWETLKTSTAWWETLKTSTAWWKKTG